MTQPVEQSAKFANSLNRKRIDATTRAITVFLLSVALLTPMIGTFTALGQRWRTSENRKLANLPRFESWKPADLLAAIDGARRFIRDRFGFRGPLIRMRSLLLVRGLGVTPNNAVIVGGDGYFYYTLDRGVESFVGEFPYSPAELDRAAELLNRRANEVQTRVGAKFVYVVVPAKESIYPQFMPAYLQQRRALHPQSTRLDQLFGRMRDENSLLFVDLRKALVKAAASERIWQKLDSHWNQRGAYAAYHAIISAAVERGLLTTLPVPRSEFAQSEHLSPGGDIAGMLELEDILSEHQLALSPRITLEWNEKIARFENSSSRGPRLLMVGDSFLPSIAPFMAESFSAGAFVQGDYTTPEMIEQLRPEIVIQEIAERKLNYFMSESLYR